MIEWPFILPLFVFILFTLWACIWATRGRVFLHTCDMNWHLTCWSVECVKWLCASSELALMSFCVFLLALSYLFHCHESRPGKEERHLELTQVAPVALTDIQPIPRHYVSPASFPSAANLIPNGPSTRAACVLCAMKIFVILCSMGWLCHR